MTLLDVFRARAVGLGPAEPVLLELRAEVGLVLWKSCFSHLSWENYSVKPLLELGNAFFESKIVDLSFLNYNLLYRLLFWLFWWKLKLSFQSPCSYHDLHIKTRLSVNRIYLTYHGKLLNLFLCFTNSHKCCVKQGSI